MQTVLSEESSSVDDPTERLDYSTSPDARPCMAPSLRLDHPLMWIQQQQTTTDNLSDVRDELLMGT